METKYVKMNNNSKQLSLGNFCRIIKEVSLNKSFANQTEVFYAIFGVEDISDSTINNYCIGYRAIGSKFKNIILKRKHYPNEEFDETIISLLSILKGQILSGNEDAQKLSKDNLLKKVALELYNIAKNDETVDQKFTKDLNKLINEEKIYDAICEVLIYVILEKKQPVYVDKTEREIFENILNNTNISVYELEQFLNIQMNDGINYTYSIKRLAKNGNPYACFEMGNLEFKGEMTGVPRYVKAYDYYKMAADKNHPRASWMIAKMLLEGKIGNKSEEDINKAFEYLHAAEALGSVSAINTIGVCYQKGLIPNEKKNIKKAIEYFEKASAHEYVYAYNNLGLVYEELKDYEKAIYYFECSANLDHSWACNKLGLWYLKGTHVKKDIKKSYEYFKKALDVPVSLINSWAYFNLAKYFYLEGSYEANVEKNISLAITYFENCLDKIPEAYKELILIYIDKYTNTKDEEDLNHLNDYLSTFRLKKEYKKYEKIVEEKLEVLKNKKLQVTVVDN